MPLIECIRNGTTTVIDHHASPSSRDGSLDLIEAAVRRAGIRASLCYEVSDRNSLAAGVEENRRFIAKVGKGDGQIAAMMGLHASFTLSDTTLESCVGIARDAGVGCHIHVAEDAADRDDSVKKFGVPTVVRLEKLGVAGASSLFIHCVHIDEHEMDRIVAIRNAAERLAMNSPIQGTAADMLKLAMIKVHRALLAGDFKTRMLLTVHDEMVFDMHKSERESVVPIIEECMKSALPMKVPIVVEVGIGANWLEAH